MVFKPAKISQSRTLRKNRGQKQRIDRQPHLSPIVDVDNEVNASVEQPSLDPFADANALIVNAPASVSHKPSFIGSASVYSTESGEERQYVGDSSSVLAALGPPGLDALMVRSPRSISHKPSHASSIYSSQSGEERDFRVPSNFLGQDRRRFSTYTHNSGLLYYTAEEQLPAIGVSKNVGDAT